MSSLPFVQNTIDWGGWALAGEKGVGFGCNSSPSKYVEKALIARQTQGHFSKLDLTQTFE